MMVTVPAVRSMIVRVRPRGLIMTMRVCMIVVRAIPVAGAVS